MLWEGASLWAFDSPPETALRRSTEVHAHHALQFTLAVEGAFRFQIGPDSVEGPALLIAPDVAHAYHPVGRNAMIFVEPESREGSALLRFLDARPYARLDPAPFCDVADRLTAIWRPPRLPDTTLADLGRALAARLAGADQRAHGMDQRITRVLARLNSGETLDLSAAAGVACVSPSRFSHLFVSEVGLPFRTYLLWRRLVGAVGAIAAGADLTEAAHGAGFADSAHFSRTFLRMFGVPASLLLMI